MAETAQTDAPAALFLARFVGAYDLMGATMPVARQGPRALQLVLPGQPPYDRQPRRGTEFRLAGLFGFAIEFAPDASGAVTEAVVTQPDGVYRAPRTG